MSGQGNKRPNELIEHAPVTLRRYRAEDADALFDAVTGSLDHLRPWMPWAADYSRESAEEYLAGSIKGWDEGTEYNYAILTGDALAGKAMAGRVLVGSIGLMTTCGPGPAGGGGPLGAAEGGRGAEL